VSRITRGRLEVKPERVALKAIVDSAIEIAQPAMTAGKHQLTVELPPEPLELEVDAIRIAQVLGNLLTNAAKYTPSEGKVRLAAERNGGDALVRVIDNGIGLAPEDLSRIFEMFTQVTPAKERANSGLGIGLALSKALVELHGGAIEAKSGGPGQGSEFVVRLPLS
jgi:signal transduction histidine kinase